MQSLDPQIGWSGLYEAVGQGVWDIYSLSGNLPYLDKLGTGRFDAYTTLLALSGGASVLSPESHAWGLSPNPVVAGTGVRIDFAPSASHRVGSELRIYDVAGRCVRRLPVPTGVTTLDWDGCDTQGRPVGAGIYAVRLSHDAPSTGGRIVMVR